MGHAQATKLFGVRSDVESSATSGNQHSPWEIGHAFYDQRDWYTRDGRINDAGYGHGASQHPEVGSFAYPRHFEVTQSPDGQKADDVDLYEREAWPWLNYFSAKDDPYFRHLSRPHNKRPGLWARLKAHLANSRPAHFLYGDSVPISPEQKRLDRRIWQDVDRAFAFRRDIDTSNVEVTVRNGDVTLNGTVPNLRSKRMAEETVAGIREVRNITNRLTIARDDPRDTNALYVMPLVAL